jgi:hypothetical protein
MRDWRAQYKQRTFHVQSHAFRCSLCIAISDQLDEVGVAILNLLQTRFCLSLFHALAGLRFKRGPNRPDHLEKQQVSACPRNLQMQLRIE